MAYIPAWRRVGLELESERPFTNVLPPRLSANSNVNVPSLHASTSSNKRKLIDPQIESGFQGDESSGNLNGAKKSRKNRANGLLRTEASSNQTQETSIPSSSLTHHSQRKTVKFSQDTKTEDGDTRRSIQKAPWAGVPLSNATSTSLRPHEQNFISSTGQSIQQINQQQTKLNTPKSLKNTSTSVDPSPLVQYLEDYKSSPKDWKFNKAKQNKVLKHALNPDAIPEKHEPALGSYLSGLRSQSARDRLRDEATAIRDEDDRDLSSSSNTKVGTDEANNSVVSNDAGGSASEDRKRAYKAALREWLRRLKANQLEYEELEHASDPSWQHRFQRRRRAELIYKWTTEGVNTPEGLPLPPEGFPHDPSTIEVVEISKSTVGSGPGKPNRLAKKRNRKRRTQVPDDDTSSSDSSIPDSSDAEDDSQSDKKTQQSKAATAESKSSGDKSDSDSRSSESSGSEDESEASSGDEDDSEDEISGSEA